MDTAQLSTEHTPTDLTLSKILSKNPRNFLDNQNCKHGIFRPVIHHGHPKCISCDIEKSVINTIQPITNMHSASVINAFTWKIHSKYCGSFKTAKYIIDAIRFN